MSDDYTVGELAREFQRAMLRMESLAARMEGGQFVSSEVFRVWKEGHDSKYVGLIDRVDQKANVSDLKNLEHEIESLKDDRKWLVRLILAFIVMGILGFAFVAGGVPAR